MGLSIKNEEVEARVRRLAQLTGLGVTEAVDDAVTRRLQEIETKRTHEAEQEYARLMAALEAIDRKYGKLTPIDLEAIDNEIYDENGIER